MLIYALKTARTPIYVKIMHERPDQNASPNSTHKATIHLPRGIRHDKPAQTFTRHFFRLPPADYDPPWHPNNRTAPRRQAPTGSPGKNLGPHRSGTRASHTITKHRQFDTNRDPPPETPTFNSPRTKESRAIPGSSGLVTHLHPEINGQRKRQIDRSDTLETSSFSDVPLPLREMLLRHDPPSARRFKPCASPPPPPVPESSDR